MNFKLNLRLIREELFLLSIFVPLFFGIILILTQVKSPTELFKSDIPKLKIKNKIKAKVQEEKKVETTPIASQNNLLQSLSSPSLNSGNLNSLTAGLVSSSSSGSGGMNVSQGEVSQGQMIENTGGEKRGARVTNVVNPTFPPSAQSRGISGYVILEISISDRGKIDDVVVIDSKPKGIFENAAIEAVRRWSFEPAISEGKTISTKLKQKVNFELD